MAIRLTSSDTFDLQETGGIAPASRTDRAAFTDTPAWLNATGAMGITKQWNSNGPVALNTTNVTLNLTTGLTNGLGVVVAFTKIKWIRIKNSGAAGVLTIGAAASNPWIGLLNATGTLVLPLGAVFKLWSPDPNGWPVVATTGDLLKIANSGNGSYEMELAGE